MRFLKASFAFVSSLVFCMSLYAYDFGDLLSLNHNFENYYSPVKRQSRSIASELDLPSKEKKLSPLLDLGVNLDVNGNGKDDTWRTMKSGRLASSKSDLNEDGNIDVKVEYDQFGREVKYLRDTNYDGSFDVKKKCENEICITLVDNDFDNSFDTKVVEDFRKKLRKVFTRNKKNWKFHYELKIESRASQTEGSYAECDNCKTAIQSSFKTELNLKELSEMITEEYLTTAPAKVEVDGGGYFQATKKFGVLVHSSCFAENSKPRSATSLEDFRSKVDSALSEFDSCVDGMRRFSEENGLDNRFNNFIENIYLRFTNLLNPARPMALKPKIACVDMKRKETSSEFIAVASSLMDNSSWDGSITEENVLGTLMGPPYVSYLNQKKFIQSATNGDIKENIVHELCHNIGYSHDTLPDYCNVISGLMSSCRSSKNYEELKKSRVFLAAYNQATMAKFKIFSSDFKYVTLTKAKGSDSIKQSTYSGYWGLRSFLGDHRKFVEGAYYDRIKYLSRIVDIDKGMNQPSLSNDDKVKLVSIHDRYKNGGMALASKCVLENCPVSSLPSDLSKIYYYIFRDKHLDFSKREVSNLISSIDLEKLTNSRGLSMEASSSVEPSKEFKDYYRGLLEYFKK